MKSLNYDTVKRPRVVNTRPQVMTTNNNVTPNVQMTTGVIVNMD